MTRTHLRKILGDIMARKGRTVLVALSIFVGVLGVITLFTVRNLITRQLNEDLQQDEIAMIDILVSVGEEVENNEATLAVLQQATGASIVEGQAIYPVNFRKPGDDEFETVELRSYSSPLQDVQIEPMRLVEGDWSVPGQNQVMLERRMADRYEFEVGDSIEFRTSNDSSRSPEIWEVAGIVFHPYSHRAPSSFGGFTPGPDAGIYAQFEDSKSLLAFGGYSNLVARYENFSEAEANFESFQRAVTDNTNYEIILPILEDPAQNQQLVNAENFNSVLSMLSFVAMIVSGFLVVNVINAIVVEQKKQIGSMKAVGASDRDIFMIYVGIALAYGLIGTVLAIVPSIFLGNAAARNLAPQLDVLLEGFSVSPLAILTGIVLGIIVPALSAIVPVYNGNSVSIMEAMTDLGISQDYQFGPVARVTNWLPVATVMKQALSNIARQKGRLALTGFTLTSAVAAFMGVTAVGESLTTVTEDIFGRLGYQVLVLPNEVLAVDDTIAAIESVEEVETVNRGTIVAVKVEGDYVNFFTGDDQLVIFGFDPDSGVWNFKYADGNGWSENPDREGIVITRSLAEQLGVALGDEVTFTVRGISLTREVIGIDTASLDSVFMRWNELSEMLELRAPELLGGQLLSNGYYVSLKDDDPSVEEVDKAIEEIGTAMLSNGITIQTTRNQIEQNVETTRFINQNIGILNLSAALIALVGGIGLLTTLAMAVFERQKEIGVMRAIGAGSRVIMTQFVLEGVLIGLIAWIVAIPLSYFLAVQINAALGLETIRFTYPLEVLILGVGGMLAISSVASIGPSMTAARKTVSSIIRYQ